MEISVRSEMLLFSFFFFFFNQECLLVYLKYMLTVNPESLIIHSRLLLEVHTIVSLGLSI